MYFLFMNLLINLPDYRHIHGGVTNHYIGLRPYWKENVRYNRIGKRREGWSGMLWLPWDYTAFAFRMLFGRWDAAMINPSLNMKAWQRDRVFMKIARRLGRKTAVMFHGWTQEYLDSLDKRRFAADLNGCSAIFVLNRHQNDELIKAGVTAPIYPTTTKVSDGMLEGFDIGTRKGAMRKFLFLSRILDAKGIYTVLDMFSLIAEEYPDATLTVAGDGPDEAAARRYAEERGIPRVTFTGHLGPEGVAEAMRGHDIYLLPSLTEGMPTSVLEAMAFGLPVVTRPVGALADFFEDGKMGILTESTDGAEYCRLVKPLMDDPERVEAISRYNHAYATSRFLASAVASRMEENLRQALGCSAEANPQA